ncbi:uncharacterized protein LOC123320697 [Coccinella septempunctata]|uniref:uncharacterized protein LOC123320697 n=1 Tax=Coccinella septempunctata TaxID=41139 RepID=UPI001D080D4B|nr:uncharacterized protein LOC123320697 [Coccinella septempunctata]
MSSEKICAVPECGVKVPSSGVRWFSIPDSTSLISSVVSGKTVYFSRRRLWLNSLGLDDAFLEKDAVVCALHFGDQDFEDPEGGKASLKENAVPSQNLPAKVDTDADVFKIGDNESQSTNCNENEIETVEKSDDDDDDIEIIEPHREIITLDDDDCDDDNGPNKVASGENVSTNNTIPTIVNEKIRLLPPSNLTIEKEKESSPVKKKTLLPKVRVILSENKSPSTNSKRVDEPQVVNQDKTPNKDPSKQNGKKISGIITAEGKRFIVQAATKTGQLKALSPILINEPSTSQSPKKFVKIPDMKKIRVGKQPPIYKMQVFTGKKGAQLTDADVSEALKKQLSQLLQHKAVLQASMIKEDKTNDKTVPIVGKPIRVIEIPPFTKGNKEDRCGPSKTDSPGPPLHLIPNPKEVQSPKPKGVQKKNSSTGKNDEVGKKESGVDPSSDFKYVNISDILRNGSVEEGPKEGHDSSESIDLPPIQDENISDDVPFGFSDIYNLINKYIVDFSFEVLGTKYVLKECGLHFEPQIGDKKEKTVAVVGKSSISCKDPLLLSGMNVSIGISNKNIDPRLYSKKVTHKCEKINRVNAVLVKPNLERIGKNQKDSNIVTVSNNKNSLLENCLTGINKAGDVKTYLGKNKSNTKNTQRNAATPVKPKVVVQPSKSIKSKDSLDLKASSSTSVKKTAKNTRERTTKAVVVGNQKEKSHKLSETLEDRRKEIKKKRTLKMSTSRSRKLFKMPVSQMNPALRALSVVGSKFRKNRRLVMDNEKGKKPIERKTILRPILLDKPEPIPKEENTNKEEEEPSGSTKEKSSKIRTRGATKGVKKDYKTFSLYGTMEETNSVKTKRKRPTKVSPSKKLKYSDKVGDIESFLEVVLEPDNKDEMELDTSKSYNTDDTSF